MRTTVDLDSSILRTLKQIQKEERKSLGALISELLAQALASRSSKTGKSAPKPRWHSRDMGRPLVDLQDKEALWRILDNR